MLCSAQLTQLGFRHGFSLKGLSEESPCPKERDRRKHVPYEAMAVTVGYPKQALYEVDQVHGGAVRVIQGGEAAADIRSEKADALVARDAPGVVGVRVADCVALLLADADSGAVAAVHAGWRGVVARVVPAAVEALCTDANARPERIFGAVSPHIRRCCFEVGRDVAEQLAAVCPSQNAVDTSFERPHVDLAAIIRGQLRQCGVPDAHIDDLGGCTRCEAACFHSFRRDGAEAGRHLAVIAARGTYLDETF
jgi:polyphenol oxidase